MAGPNIKSILKGLNKNWKAEAARAKAEPGFSEKPDGIYTARFSKAEIALSGQQRPQIVTSFVVVNGEFVGELIRSYEGLDGENSLFYVAKNLQRYGYDPESVDLESLPDLLAELTEEKPYVQLRLKTGKNDYQNVYVQKVLDADDVEDETGEEGAGDDDADGADDDSDDDQGEAWEVGDRATFEKNGVTVAGEITKIDGDNAKVKRDDNGKVATVALEDLSPEYADDDDNGDSDEDDDDNGDADADDDEGVTPEVGMTAQFTTKGVLHQGEIVEIVDEDRVKIKSENDGKRYTVPIEKIAIVDESELDGADDDDDADADDEPAQKPAASGKKTPPPATGKKPAPAAAPEPSKKPGAGKAGAGAAKKPAGRK